jgi:hypothetical protein
LSGELSKYSKDMRAIEQERLSHRTFGLLRDMVIRAYRSGVKENRWWEQSKRTGAVLIAGFTHPIGELGSWTEQSTKHFIYKIANGIKVGAAMTYSRFSKIYPMNNIHDIQKEAQPAIQVNVDAKRAAATQRKQKSREKEIVDADSEEMKAKRDRQNQKRRDRYCEKNQASKNSEAEMLGKRGIYDEAIDISDSGSEGQHSN